MSELKAAFEQRGFQNVATYINSGNVLLNSKLDEAAVKTICEALIADSFGLEIPVCVISAAELTNAVLHTPEWWNKNADSKHNAFFVIPPMTAAELCARVGELKDEYEKAAYHGRVIFWSAPIATFSRTRWSKAASDKTMSCAFTVRNANTTLKLCQMVAEI
jgi:uncharacterized protein (DUF1697 family)